MAKLDNDWYIECECVDCHCRKLVIITDEDEDGDYLRLCDECLFGDHE